MIEFNHPEHEATFFLPEKPTIRQLMAYDGFEFLRGRQMYERFWDAARTVMQDWECELLPDIEISLDEAGTEEQLEIIKWACLLVWDWRYKFKQDQLPKN